MSCHIFNFSHGIFHRTNRQFHSHTTIFQYTTTTINSTTLSIQYTIITIHNIIVTIKYIQNNIHTNFELFFCLPIMFYTQYSIFQHSSTLLSTTDTIAAPFSNYYVVIDIFYTGTNIFCIMSSNACCPPTNSMYLCVSALFSRSLTP